ncbi:hypothetical protein SPRG_09462 [Saprolegnia parasitica CBS 223.65]|uniref:Impact N-terminal domain-containing protein n=1 Tax=Saprolegnia parasitica (strain CBS 223.65) TaxID=695850 RepID=A0A067C382_SAPPC|nr:hypothetical protein SPRG_09462 [Saprolegnia parasitica CBS 223.65]KDO25199.1 hypothetical protein SPRG_09462 [Saprolegnia parasitica CBS 223.65]|eukprot:XP_012204050.1 hypothetical protein SPRG_09462 [Saprolegnia parasitica CBS 223.65]
MKFLSIARAVEAEVPKIKGSRFIGFVSPVTSRQDALAVVAARRAIFPQANHHCFAYTLASPPESFASDDGEPHNSAGRPILHVLQQHDVLNVCLVVSRIFGGTKLGTGGLVRAYNSAAKCAMEAASVQETCVQHIVSVLVPIHAVAVVKKALHRFDGHVETLTIEGDSAILVSRLPLTHAMAFESMVSESTNGRAIISQTPHIDAS